MKKLFSLLFTIFLVNSFMFADKSRFYENGKVINTMYVDSEDGLRVRDYPSLKSNRLCGLTHRFPVKIVAIGKEETIDGITAPWVEILIPSYEWKSKTPEYGWVFGGYLSEQQPEFIIPRTKNELTQYLESSFWNLYWEYGGSSDDRFGYFADGKMFELNNYDVFFDVDDTTMLVNFNAVSGDMYYSDEYSFWMSPSVYTNEVVKQFLLKKGTFELTCIDERWFSNSNGSACSDEFVWDFMPHKVFPPVKSATDKIFYNNRIYAIFENENIIQNLYEKNKLSESVAIQCIKLGISAKDTPYEEAYNNYWEPIMKEHQKKADGKQ